MIRLAINGFGRIGRQAFKIAHQKKDIKVIAINDLTDNKTLAHLLKYDTAYPNFNHKVDCDDEHLIIDNEKIIALSEKDPAKLPWRDLDIDVVIESTGVFRTKDKANLHLQAGAKKVVLSAPGKGDGIKTFVRGLNDDEYNGEDIIDNASCTTNCTAPIMKVLETEFGLHKAMLTTIHSFTADQRLQDAPHKDLRRARAASQNIVPTTTGAAVATTKVVPSLENLFSGIAVRVPTITVSLVDINALIKTKTDLETLKQAFIKASQTYLKGVLSVSNEQLVSTDYIANPYSSIVDLDMLRIVDGDLIKIIAWYDNEFGYSNRLIEMVSLVGKNL